MNKTRQESKYLNLHISSISWLFTWPAGNDKKILLSALTVLLISGLNFGDSIAQQTVTGTVTDAGDETTIPGVNVIVEGSAEATGSTIGATTNLDGEYSINVPTELNTLVFTFVGYERQVVEIDGRTQIDVAMQRDVSFLEDLVVVGYGTERQEDATGSVLSLSERDFNRGVISSPEQLLQGRIAGVQITSASGEPGAGVNIRIRGTSSVRGGNQPLFVVDGVPLSGNDVTPGSEGIGAGSQSPRNPLSFLNPDDIENISVLKDASAAAIYGARGSNGVVLITTKQTTGLEPRLTVSSSASMSNIRNKIDLLSADEYVQAGSSAGADPDVIDFGSTTDWQDQIFRTAMSQDYNISYGSGSETGSYRLSLGYADQQGIIENSALERLTARINASQSWLDDLLSLDLNITTSRIHDSYAPVGNTAGFEGDLVGAALQANPTRPVFESEGIYMQSSDFRNPAGMLAYIDDNSETNRLLANVGGTVNFTDWLAYRATLGYENSESVRRMGASPNLDFADIRDRGGRATIDNWYVNSQLMEHTLNLQQLLGGGEIDVLGGFSYQRFENRSDWLQAEFFVTDEIPIVDNVGGVNNDDNKAFTASSQRTVDEIQSFFGRVNYNYDDRYLLTSNFRVDGSTKFGRNNKYGYFPSLALAWRLSNEEFFSGLSSTVNELKIRGSYGITGNQEFPSNVSLAVFRTNNDGSLTQSNNPNPDIQWEETVQWGVGTDFELFDGRLGGTIEYFNKQTQNLIFRQDFAQPAAVDFQWVNLDGTVLNRGWEFALNTSIVNTSRLFWRVDYNMSFLHNEVKDLDTFVNTGQIHGQGLSGAYAQRIAEGQPLFAFYMREFEGFDENGLGIYANNEELDFVGDPIPDFTLGFTNSFAFGRFDANVFMEGAFGFQVYNNTANAIFLKGNLRNGRNVTREIADSPESPNNFGEASTRFLEDGDYLRLANVNIGYNVDMAGLGLGTSVRNVRIGLTGQNLFLITNYSGFDPEVDTDKSIDGIPSLGIDYTAFPRARTVTFNIRLEI
ncbi:MAG: SusC/RagA family TonB-linked outer membrane protein [Balneolales bacterium]